MKSTIAIILGEASGIGPEITVKALSNRALREKSGWVIIGDKRILQSGQSLAGANLTYNLIHDINETRNITHGQIMFYDLSNTDLNRITAGKLDKYSAQATVETIRKAIALCQQAGISKLYFGPLCKEGFKLAGINCISERDYFVDCLNEQNTTKEINIIDNLWIGRVTSHIPISQVAAQITKANVFASIKYLAETRGRYSKDKAKIAVAALNPHCGENGLVGDEEITAIRPAIARANQVLDAVVEGPFSADTIMKMALKDKYNSVLSMYHDQIQSAMKLIAFDKGVTLFLGLSIIFATPAHGVAYDLAGQGVANASAAVSALETLVKMNSV